MVFYRLHYWWRRRLFNLTDNLLLFNYFKFIKIFVAPKVAPILQFVPHLELISKVAN